MESRLAYQIRILALRLTRFAMEGNGVFEFIREKRGLAALTNQDEAVKDFVFWGTKELNHDRDLIHCLSLWRLAKVGTPCSLSMIGSADYSK